MNKKVALVTGGAGFIGSHLCEYLLDNNFTVYAVDDLSTGFRENIAHISNNNNFKFIEGCASDINLIDSIAEKCSFIFHLAAVVGVKRVIDNPVKTVEINHAATKTVLHAANKHNCRIIITSTSEVYGANKNPSFNENDICMIGPTQHKRWCYSASKLLDEFHAFAFYYQYNLPVTIVRLFNTIGPRQVGNYGMVVPTFIKQALNGENITVYGNGNQKRCFTYVKDVAKSLFLLINNEKSIGQVFNIGSNNEISINNLAELIINKTKSNSQIINISYRKAYGENFEDVERRNPDTQLLYKTINYKPDTPLDTVIDSIIEYFVN
jgi:UDP-glucose 4-epimerase